MGAIQNLETSPLGRVYVYTVKGKYLLDDKSIDSELLSIRRLRMEPRDMEVYKFRGRIDTLRQLVKYPSGTIFVDKYGDIFKYKKGRKRHLVESRKILKRTMSDKGMLLHIDGIPTPHLLEYKTLEDRVKFVSVMLTDKGPLIYDYTATQHEPYRRSI